VLAELAHPNGHYKQQELRYEVVGVSDRIYSQLGTAISASALRFCWCSRIGSDIDVSIKEHSRN
jgi:hypothetical protein